MEDVQKAYSCKACEIHPQDRIQVGLNFSEVPKWRQLIAIPFIYVPIFVTFPFAIMGAFFTVLHFKVLGAKNMKRYRDFLPDKASYRYPHRKDYIVISPTKWWNFHLRFKAFWFFNCTFYCPWSVALFEYLSYLVKAVENWWCPFYHDKKSNYANASMDRSFWHTYLGWKKKLHPDDAECPIWNDKAAETRKE